MNLEKNRLEAEKNQLIQDAKELMRFYLEYRNCLLSAHGAAEERKTSREVKEGAKSEKQLNLLRDAIDHLLPREDNIEENKKEKDKFMLLEQLINMKEIMSIDAIKDGRFYEPFIDTYASDLTESTWFNFKIKENETIEQARNRLDAIAKEIIKITNNNYAEIKKETHGKIGKIEAVKKVAPSGVGVSHARKLNLEDFIMKKLSLFSNDTVVDVKKKMKKEQKNERPIENVLNRFEAVQELENKNIAKSDKPETKLDKVANKLKDKEFAMKNYLKSSMKSKDKEKYKEKDENITFQFKKKEKGPKSEKTQESKTNKEKVKQKKEKKN